MRQQIRLRVKYKKRPRTKRTFDALRGAWCFLTIVLAIVAFSAAFAGGQSGVLIPSPGERPDPKVLSLAFMSVDIRVDDQHATVKVIQIFQNHSSRVLEGRYIFGLPASGTVSDFAVWDGYTRIPGVMMEKRRANAIYEGIKQQQIDPGILQTTGSEESSTGFSARIFPIDGYGTKRLEMEYTEDLSVENFMSTLSFPLKPAYGETQNVGELHIKIAVKNDRPIEPLLNIDAPYHLNLTGQDANAFTAEFRGMNIQLTHDLSFGYRIATGENAISVIAHRGPERITAYDLKDPKLAERRSDGYFQARALFGGVSSDTQKPKNILMLMDISLSMYGDRLLRAVETAEFILNNLGPEDRFNLILFSNEATPLFPQPRAGGPESAEYAMRFIKNSTLGGGTNLKLAFEAASAHASAFPGRDVSLIMISDFGPTLETINTARIAATASRLRLFAFAIGGGEAAAGLVGELTRITGGAFVQMSESEEIAPKLQVLLQRIGTEDIRSLQLLSSDNGNIYDIYPIGDSSYFGSTFSFVGRYRKPKEQRFSVTGVFGSQPIELSKTVLLPDLSDEHAHLPRIWAKARVNVLLREIDRRGENEEMITEIIRLSEKYKFVTPYTAFIAAPRALLRPRLIQPGDPVIRVKTDPSVTGVYAVLPFGETLPLKFSAAENVWETRFLAPAWMVDGTYHCRLILTDKNGNGYEEKKSFVIDSRAPKLVVTLSASRVKAGDDLEIRVSADADTKRITAKLYGARPVDIRWSAEEKINIGRLTIPSDIVSGKYVVTVLAEDFARNQSHHDAEIEVAGR